MSQPVLNFAVHTGDSDDFGSPVSAVFLASESTTQFQSFTMFREESLDRGDPPTESPTNSDGTQQGEFPTQQQTAEQHTDPHSSPPVDRQQRNRSATGVMNLQRNGDPNAANNSGDRSVSASLSPGATTSKKMYSVGAVQIKSTMISDAVNKALADPPSQENSQEMVAEARYKLLSALCAEEGETPVPSKTKRKAPPTTLPTELKLPMSLRCDFCQKFDSVCSNCHFKWRGIAESRRAVFTSNFSAFPDHRRIAILFNAAAFGTIPFLSAALDGLPPARVSELQTTFVPPIGTATMEQPALMELFDQAGSVTLLHVACGMGRLDIVKLLLQRGAMFRKSTSGTRKMSPLELLPTPLPQDWLEMLEDFKTYEHYTMIERARRLRLGAHYEDALLEYQAVIKENPYSELARCGIAKTMFDMGDLEECIRACDSVLHDQREIKWLEHIPESVMLLKSEALKAFHDACHKESSTALRRCGCIIIDPVMHRVRIRKLSYRLLIDKALAYCDCSSLWSLWQATRIPLLQSATERIASKIGLESVGLMLTNEFGYAEMYETIRADEPPLSGPQMVLKPPLRFIGVQVIAMADFHTFLMRASVVGNNPKYSTTTSFFGKKSEDSKRARIVATKCFRVNRACAGKAWDVRDGGEWEIDDEASDALLIAVQQRMTTR